MLKQTYFSLIQKYADHPLVVEAMWAEIELSYSHPGRYYHTLAHLGDLLYRLREIKGMIQEWDVILFSIYYHDVVYNILKNDNEEKSAQLANTRLNAIGVPGNLVQLCLQQILATKNHSPETDPDTNHFTDADLSILGQDWPRYSAYAANVRKEYAYYPDEQYNPGRKKVLEHFLQMKNIYKTDFFFQKFENNARKNLQRELEILL
ncbi:MAG TPA: hypothetical protein VNB90_16245 [Cytophagaceae bacterium]|nr:hypothetical protein [Cytophagaceae bacterium]